jgi:DNA-binding CsgD family transcriptional regulator
MRVLVPCSPEKGNAPFSQGLKYPSLRIGELPEPVWPEIARSLLLSNQQLQIVQGIFADQTEQAIASRLNISHHTVHTHCERLYRKLGVTGRVRLVLRLLDEYHTLILSRKGSLPPLCSNFAVGNCPLQGIRI